MPSHTITPSVSEKYPRDQRGLGRRLLSESSVLLEAGALLLLRRQLLRHIPRGDGHPVILIPGFTATDRSMGLLRRFLVDAGYNARGWGQGRNRGVNEDTLLSLENYLQALCDEFQQPVSVIGWSGGGMYARALAHRQAGSIRQVITMGSPFKLTEETLHYLPEGITRLHDRLSPNDDTASSLGAEAWLQSPPVPSTSLYSERDGLAPWPFCLDESDRLSQNLQVPGSHAGMPASPFTFYVIADRLAQPAGQWRPFALQGLRQRFYRQSCASQFDADTECESADANHKTRRQPLND